ncbi:hypothetical protein DFH07DRAFT_768920 [Mycena maculata]|uniref:Uncharacterized protein n=1 Tax=Mycena maculata TaxID=230809 RepID=A0AAD7JUA1_9AGAR|nr:hypothetical protein DFH07DRAFT_768920 [Mycena maculata]
MPREIRTHDYPNEGRIPDPEKNQNLALEVTAKVRRNWAPSATRFGFPPLDRCILARYWNSHRPIFYCMDSPLLNDDEEDEHYERTWVAAHWIGCGREYHNIPPVVEAAQRNIFKILSSSIGNLPNKNMSIIAQLLVFEVPPIED